MPQPPCARNDGLCFTRPGGAALRQFAVHPGLPGQVCRSVAMSKPLGAEAA